MQMASDPSNPKELYDEQKRGSAAPDYSAAEGKYRSNVLSMLQMDYMLREQTHMELDDKTYSEYYLINRQQDMAYNPPRRNPSDSRIVSGITHEKDSTIVQILADMNFQPKIKIFDKDDTELEDAGTLLTARLKKSLQEDKFTEKLSDFFRVNIGQGNVFIREKPYSKKFTAKKIPIGDTSVSSPFLKKWTTIVEEETVGCTSELIPNTAVFFPNLLEKDLHKQDHIFVVLHIPEVTVARIFKNYPRWLNVPKAATRNIPQNVNGVWGDYFLQQPADKYMEVIWYESEARNEQQIYINSTQMLPIQEEGGIITGYPLTEDSPSGCYSIIKGDNEPIPFFAYGKSVPSKTEVKEETVNELMRLMVFKMRQSAKPPIGNNSTKVLPANIWDPGVVTPDISKDDLSILTPNGGITPSDFSFYKLVMESIGDSSVNDALEGSMDQQGVTATQYVDQKKQQLKKLGLSIDNAIAFIKECYWQRLFNDAQMLTKKVKQYDHTTGELVEAYSDFIMDQMNPDGTKSKVQVKFTDDNTQRAGLQGSQDILNEEEAMGGKTKKLYARPDYITKLVNGLRDKIYIDVMSEPEGQEQSLLTILFNLLTEYANLRGGQIPNLNYDYLDKIIGENSGFEADKLFLKAVPQQQLDPNNPNPGAVGPGAGSGAPAPKGKASAPVLPRNPALNNGNAILAQTPR
jgi:hypothetical protein